MKHTASQLTSTQDHGVPIANETFLSKPSGSISRICVNGPSSRLGETGIKSKPAATPPAVKVTRNVTKRLIMLYNETKPLAEFAKSHPPPVPPPKIPIFWDLPSIHPFYWDKKELPEFEDNSLRQEFHAKLAEPLRKVIETHSTFLNDASEFKKLAKDKKRDNLMDLSNAFRKCRGIIGKSFRTT